MITRLVYKQKTVMCFACKVYGNGIELLLKASKIFFQSCLWWARIDFNGYTLGSFFKQLESLLIYKIIHEHNGLFGKANQVRSKSPGFKNLSFAKYSFHWWQRCTLEKINLIANVCKLG